MEDHGFKNECKMPCAFIGVLAFKIQILGYGTANKQILKKGYGDKKTA